MQVGHAGCQACGHFIGAGATTMLGAGWQRHRRLSHHHQLQQRAAGSSHAALWEEHLSQMKPVQMKPAHFSAATGAGAAGGRRSISRRLQAPLGHLAHAHGAGLRGGAKHRIHLQVGSQPAKIVTVLTVRAIKARQQELACTWPDRRRSRSSAASRPFGGGTVIANPNSSRDQRNCKPNQSAPGAR